MNSNLTITNDIKIILKEIDLLYETANKLTNHDSLKSDIIVRKILSEILIIKENKLKLIYFLERLQ